VYQWVKRYAKPTDQRQDKDDRLAAEANLLTATLVSRIQWSYSGATRAVI